VSKFKLEVIGIDSDSWIVTDYEGEVLLSIDSGSIIPTSVAGFWQGMTKATCTIVSSGTVTITTKDKYNEQVIGTATLYVQPAASDE
jgi:hypothetical protein